MLLENKNALVFAATGDIAWGVACRLKSEGATVYLSARSASGAGRAKELGASFDVVDATDPSAVSSYVDAIAAKTEGIDVVFNGIGGRPAELGYGTPAIALEHERFLEPLRRMVGSQFLTARAAARHMIRRRSGSIVLLSASLSGQFVPLMSGITAACGAIEALTRTLAAEFGPAGVRVNCVRAGGMPETRTIQETIGAIARTTGQSMEQAAQPTSASVLKRPVRVEETAAVVAFVASDHASGVAGQVINVCAGALV